MACLHQHLVTANDIGEEWGGCGFNNKCGCGFNSVCYIIGFLPRLLQYETARQRQNLPVMGVIESLQRLFSTSFIPAALVRSVGLQITGFVQPLKVILTSHTYF